MDPGLNLAEHPSLGKQGENMLPLTEKLLSDT